MSSEAEQNKVFESTLETKFKTSVDYLLIEWSIDKIITHFWMIYLVISRSKTLFFTMALKGS